MQKLLSFTIIISIFLILPFNVQAYVDPGTGSFVIQMLFASAIGGLFTIKMYFQKIKNFFKGLNKPDENDVKNKNYGAEDPKN